jgi:hypothetical protein
MITMLDPIVTSPDVDRRAAARLTTLDGKLIGLFTNGKLNATKVLEMAGEIIQERFAPAGFVLFEDNIGFGRTQNDELEWEMAPDVGLVAIGD